MSTTDPKVRHQFVEQFGLHMEGDGMPRIAARLWAFLLLQRSPCDAESLSDELQISHGSVSTNTRLLESLGIIERVTFPGDRRAYYQLSPDPYTAVLTTRIARQQRLAEMLGHAANELPADDVARERLGALRELNVLTAEAAGRVVKEWGARRLRRAGPDDAAAGRPAAGDAGADSAASAAGAPEIGGAGSRI